MTDVLVNVLLCVLAGLNAGIWIYHKKTINLVAAFVCAFVAVMRMMGGN